jgi:hypothetical protein
MSAEQQGDTHRDESGESVEQTKKPFVLTANVRRLIAESEKKHRRQNRRQRRFEFNWISWYWDEFPSEDFYRPSPGERRNTRQEMSYHRFRQMTSWSFWSRMKSSTGIKLAAVGGLVAAFLQAAPSLKGGEAAVGPLGWLLVGGVLYVCAVLWFEVRCPVLLKRSLARNEEYLGIEGRRWLLALVEDELRRWWSIKPYLLNAASSDLKRGEDELASAIARYGDTPAYSGFCNYASAHIEYALSEFTQLTSMVVWRADIYPRELREFKPQYVMSGDNMSLRNLHLSTLNASEAKLSKVGKEGDLVLRWFDSSLTFRSRLPTHRNVMVSVQAEGLAYLFRSDATAQTFTRILAQWQNTMRPWSRLLLISLFLASGGCFAWFVILQLRILLPDLI